MASQYFKIKQVIRKEHLALRRIIEENKIEVVISDNRFGLYSEDVHAVFITHQVFLRSPFASSFLQSINRNYIERFDELWIPDHEEETNSLSGSLSHGKQFHPNVKFIGPLSRLEKIPAAKKFEHLFLLSGPEPQHSLLANILIKKAEQFPEKKFALCSPSFSDPSRKKDNLSIFTGIPCAQLSELILSSENIICRSGYSTLMDLDHLGITKMILIPTPGQTEQEYLAEYWQKKRGAVLCEQKNIERLRL